LIIGRVLVGYVFLKPYYTFKVYTVYDFLGVRFGNMSKNYVSALFLIMRTLASGTRLFVPSLVMVLAWQKLAQGKDVHFSSGAVNTVAPYLIAIVALTILTCIYTALGGIKAVIWTDVIQAVLMFGGALVAVGTLLYHVGGDTWNLSNGLHAVAEHVPQMTRREGYFLTGFENVDTHSLSVWGLVKHILASDYTIFSALIGATVGNMAAFGTDQDMVQRLLTAETYQKSRRSLITAALMDIPIGIAFTGIGILLFVYYKQDATYKPTANADVFGSYILNVMPVGIRGLVLAGVFATAMGSLSAALNALATSATNDWYIPYFARGKDESHHVAAARWFTTMFAVLMIVIAGFFALAKVTNPNVRIIPVVLGIQNFILGPMLGVFLIGMFTRTRGSDRGNMLAITIGVAATIYAGGLHNDFFTLIGRSNWIHPPIVKVSFTWFALIGAVVVFTIGVLFPTPPDQITSAKRKADEAQSGEDKPMALRES
jgi:Na+/proline symporter